MVRRTWPDLESSAPLKKILGVNTRMWIALRHCDNALVVANSRVANHKDADVEK